VRESFRAVIVDVSALREISSDFLKYEFRNALRFDLAGGQEAVGPKTHRLTILLGQTTMPALFDIKQGIATNLLLTATAEFKLETLTGDPISFSGRATTSVIMSQNPQGFANLREERDAHARVARTLADQIYYRLAMYFSKDQSKSAVNR
jgi:hypothetical protein